MFTVINVQCIDQQLSIVSAPSVASGGVNETIVKFTFCPLWDGFAKTAVFWMDEATPYRVLIDSNGECVVPPEVTAKDGRMFFGAFGVNGETKRTSTVLGYTVKKGVTVEGIEPDPTPSMYEQILAEYAETQRFYNEVVDDVTAIKEAAEAAAVSAEDASSYCEDISDTAHDALRIANEAIPKNKIAKPNGVAELDENGKLYVDDIPELAYIPTSDRGAKNGVAPLNSSGTIPYKYLATDEEELTIGTYGSIKIYTLAEWFGIAELKLSGFTMNGAKRTYMQTNAKSEFATGPFGGVAYAQNSSGQAHTCTFAVSGRQFVVDFGEEVTGSFSINGCTVVF